MFRTKRGRRYVTPGILAVLAVLATPPATAEDVKPHATKGISLTGSSTLALAGQLTALKGYAMQLRTVVLKPGAVAAYHSHARRPVVAYLVSGEYTEHRDGMPVIVHKPGEQWVEGADVAHWSENRGAVPAVLINVEVFRTR